jgi:syntaxin 16
MATRDRTTLFLRYREEASALHGAPRRRTRNGYTGVSGDEEDPHRLLSDATGLGPLKRERRTGRAHGPEPAWVHLYRDLIGDVAEVDETLARLGSLYARHLLPSFGSADDTAAALESDITYAAQELSVMLHGAERKVRLLVGADADEEAGIRRNVQKRFAAQLQEQSLEFRRKQKEYLTELRGQREAIGDDGRDCVGKARNGVSLLEFRNRSEGYSSRPGETEAALLEEEEDDENFDAHQLIDGLRKGDRVIAERNREIATIAASINDLATIVKDLAGLVVDQGTVLDRVDYNVEDVRNTTKKAVRELRVIDRYQRKRHAFWCILILAIGCGLMAILLIFKWFG